MKFDRITYLPGYGDVNDEIIERIGPRPLGQWDSKAVVAWANKFADLENELTGDEIEYDNRSSISCAFGEARGTYSNNEDLCWKQFCYIATKTQQEGRPTLIPITGKEQLMLDLLDSCPFVRPLAAVKSRHGDYTAYLYIMEVPE